VSLRLVLPQVRRGIASGVLLAMLYVLADFGAVATMRLQVFTWVIHGAYKAGFDPNRAAVLAVVLCSISLVLVMAELRIRGPRSTARMGKGAQRQRVPVALGRWAAPVVSLLFGYIGVVLGVPVVRSVQWVLAAGAGESNSGVTASEFLAAARTTLVVGALVAVVTVGLGIAVAWLNARHRSVPSEVVERSVLTLHSLPGIVVALSFVYTGTRVLLPIYQRWPLLVLGLVALMGSLAVGPLRTAFEQQPSSLTDAAMAAGSTELGAMRRVALPLAFPAIMASMATIALHTAKELPMTLLLRPSGTDTLATRLWSWAGVSDDASVGPYALALIAIALPPTAVMAYRDRRSARAAVAGEWLAR
jgi:iron(III) transport system permease protein